MTEKIPGPGEPSPRSRYPQQTDFWRLWLAGIVLFTVRWLQMLVVAIYTYQETGSAFLVTMMTMLLLLPMALFGAFMGAAIDRLNRRRALLGVFSVTLATSTAIALLAWTGRLEVWHVAVLCFVNGTAWAADISLRRMMIGDVVGPAQMATAMALDAGANNASRMLGPAIGGMLLAAGGAQAAFTVAAASYLIAIVAVLGISYRNTIAPSSGAAVLSRIMAGLKELGQSRRLSGIFAVTAIFNVFGWPFFSLVPVIGKDKLGLGAQGIGVLSSMDGVGAIIGAAFVVYCVRPAYYYAVYVTAVALFQVLLIGFAMMPQVLSAGLLLCLAGISAACFAVMQTTLVYRGASPDMRARMLGLLSVCIGLGPIGFLQLGALAAVFGSENGIIIIGIEGLLALLLTWPLWGPDFAPTPAKAPVDSKA